MRLMLPAKKYLTMGEEGCLQKDVFNWLWAKDGEWGWIVPKTMPNKAVDISRRSNKALLWKKHWGDNQKFKFDGQLLISKAHNGFAVATTADGILKVVQVEEGSDSQLWTLEKGRVFEILIL